MRIWKVSKSSPGLSNLFHTVAEIAFIMSAEDGIKQVISNKHFFSSKKALPVNDRKENNTYFANIFKICESPMRAAHGGDESQMAR